MSFNRQGALAAGYSPQEIDSYLARQQQSSPLQQGSDSINSVAPWLGMGQTAQTITGEPGLAAKRMASLPSGTGNFPQAFSNAANVTGQAMGNIFRPSQLTESALQALTLPSALKGIMSLPSTASNVGKFAIHPVRFLGQATENAVKNAGEVSPSILQQHLGDMAKLTKGLGLDQGAAESKAADWLNSLYRNATGSTMEGFGQGEAANPTLSDVLNNRTSAYNKAYDNGGQGIEKILGKNFGNAYTNIIHQAAPATKMYDAVSHVLQASNNPWARGGLYAAGTAGLASGAWNFVKNLFGGNGN